MPLFGIKRPSTRDSLPDKREPPAANCFYEQSTNFQTLLSITRTRIDSGLNFLDWYWQIGPLCYLYWLMGSSIRKFWCKRHLYPSSGTIWKIKGITKQWNLNALNRVLGWQHSHCLSSSVLTWTRPLMQCLSSHIPSETIAHWKYRLRKFLFGVRV